MHRSIIAVTALFAIFFTSCLNNVEDLTGTVQTNVSYSSDIQPIFNARCTSCHGGNISNGNLDLSSYQALMNSNGVNYGSSIIVEGDASSSGLIDSIEPDPESGISRMPQGGPFLSGNQIELIRAWINEGTQNN